MSNENQVEEIKKLDEQEFIPTKEMNKKMEAFLLSYIDLCTAHGMQLTCHDDMWIGVGEINVKETFTHIKASSWED